MAQLRVLTWHVHGSYLEALAQTGHELIVPVKAGRPEGYGGRPAARDLPPTVVEVPAAAVRDLRFDVVLCQSSRNWLVDRHELLSRVQLQLPHVYVEHDPPRAHPTDTRHIVADEPNVLLVHVTAFNALMWDNGRTPVRVIEHGVRIPPGIGYLGTLERGVVVINDLASRGRRLGRDIFEAARRQVALDLLGFDAPALGGLAPVPHDELPALLARYRFYFHPVRYTSFGMAICEAMLIGLPVVGLATTELPTVIEDGRSGLIATDPAILVERMRLLLADPALAREIGRAGQAVARERFSIERFARDWDELLHEAAGRSRQAVTASRPARAPALPWRASRPIAERGSHARTSGREEPERSVAELTGRRS